MSTKNLPSIAFFLFITFNVIASNLPKPSITEANINLAQNTNNLLFEENKGQLVPTLKGNIGKDEIKFYAHSNGVNLYCKLGMLSFVFTKTENENNLNISEATGLPISDVGVQNFEPLHQKRSGNSKLISSRIDLVLINSNPSALITPSDQQEYYENFYTSGDANHGITNVHTYKTIIYNNIYPHIDMILTTIRKGMEYSFLVHPGGNVADIKLKWTGVNKINSIENGGFQFCNALGTMNESAPKSFSDGNLIGSSFSKKDGYCGFNVEKYNKNKDLLIDPSLYWGTYYGGSALDIANGVSTNSAGNVFITGYTISKSQIATSGAYQTSEAGDYDAFVAKFNSAGNLMWATYYGSDSSDVANSICSDSDGNTYITGYTSSKNNIATTGAYQSSFGGIEDIFIAGFTSDGRLNWATYYGGSDFDEGAGISIDPSGNIYVTGWTASDGLATSGAFKTNGPSIHDAILAKFSNTGNIIWATYFGGTRSDYGQSVYADPSGNIFITGSTVSFTGLATAGAYQTSYSGSTADNYIGDAFLAKFSNTGSLSWATYFGGTKAEYGTGITSDALGNVYLTGYTSSSNNIASIGAYQTSFAGNSDAFLAKFSSTGKLKWSTYYGGPDNDVTSGIGIDPQGFLYITGYTQSTSGITNSTVYQSTLGGSKDVFLAKFNNSDSLIWASYFGGNNDDIANGISIDTKGSVYLCGNTFSSSHMATTGSYQDTIAHSTDAFLAKFRFNKPQSDAGIVSRVNPNGTACAGNQPVSVILKNYGTTNLTSVKIGWTIKGKAQVPYSWTGSLHPDSSTNVIISNAYLFISGQNTMTAYTYLPNDVADSMQDNDTAKQTFLVYSSPQVYVGSTSTICSGNSAFIGYSSTSTFSYNWTSNPAGFSSTLANPQINPTITTIYSLTETIVKTGCTNTDSVKIVVNPLPLPVASKDKSVCKGSSTNIGQIPENSHTYFWSTLPPLYTSTLPNIDISPSASIVYILSESIFSTGCTREDTINVVVNPLPKAGTIQPKTICSGDNVVIGTSLDTGTTYNWMSNPFGFTSTSGIPNVNPTSSTTYTLTKTISSTGCLRIDSVGITVKSLPIVDWTVSNSSKVYSFQSKDSSLPYNSYTWEFNDTLSATGYSVQHIFPKNATYKIKLIVHDTDGCSAEMDSSVNVTISGINLNSNNDQYDLKVFPNPFRDKTLINFYMPEAAKVKITLNDIDGKCSYQLLDKELPLGNNVLEIDALKLKLSPGTYFINLTINDQVINCKIVEVK